MKPRTILIAGSWCQVGLFVLGLTAGAWGILAAASCAIEAAMAGVASEFEE